ncbi:hypothetical protein [Candidatus Pollutiaquabacter sp.]|uniref:hypothetical protein n=1 Tax=Candidatus Pollutiaquabacter sp. TaxID=3416354 RepID=UPI003D0D2142
MMAWLIFFHLVGATIWTGGHLILATRILPEALRKRDPAILKVFEEPFEKIGIPALLVQTITGLLLAGHYLNHWWYAFRFETPMHTWIAWKLMFLGATILIAAHARIRLITRLKEENLGYLAAHIIVITLLSIAFLVLGTTLRMGGWS